MSWNVCSACNRTFTNMQYFTQHLEAESNYGCYLHYHRRRASSNDGGNDDKKRAPTPKRRKVIQNIESLIERNKQDALRREARSKIDMSVFEFRDCGDEDRGNITTTAPTTRPTKGKKPKLKDEKTTEFIPEEVKVGEGLSSGLRQFQAYVKHARHNYTDLDPNTAAAIELLDILFDRGISLGLLGAIFDWHLEYKATTTEKVTHEQVLETLMKQYNMKKNDIRSADRVTILQIDSANHCA